MKGLLRSKRRSLLLLILVYILISLFILWSQGNQITNYQYREMGLSALNLAEITANSLQLTDQDVEQLEALDFEHLLAHPANQQLKALFQLTDQASMIKYAYLVRALPPDKVKYWVSDEDTAFYGSPVGTPLDYVWLLDVIVNEDEQKIASQVSDYYMDKNRYTHAEEGVRNIDQSRQPGYLLWKDEWGTQIAGLAPIYTVEGSYIGLVGVDMYSSVFYSYRRQVISTMFTILIIPTLLLSGLYLYWLFEYRKKMNGLAYKDSLTGIYNRRGYEVHGKRLLRDAQKRRIPLSVIIGDIDYFKIFNDRYGHQDGDRALKLTAAIFAELAHQHHGAAFRYGGEEFVFIAPVSQVETLCSQLKNQVESLLIFVSDGHQVSITISLGACCKIPVTDTRLEDLLHVADQALYKAKNSGRNAYVIEYDTET